METTAEKSIGKLWRVLSSEVVEKPFPYIFVREVFDNFEEVKARFPELKPKNRKETAVLAGEFWEDIFNGEFARGILEKFKVKDKPAKINLRAVLDSPGFVLGPHTDDPKKLVSLVFYLEGDPGTSIYVPKEQGFTHDGTAHLSPEDFIKADELGPEPNSVFGFRRINRSFHGVERVKATRKTLLYNIYKE